MDPQHYAYLKLCKFLEREERKACRSVVLFTRPRVCKNEKKNVFLLVVQKWIPMQNTAFAISNAFKKQLQSNSPGIKRYIFYALKIVLTSSLTVRTALWP